MLTHIVGSTADVVVDQSVRTAIVSLRACVRRVWIAGQRSVAIRIDVCRLTSLAGGRTAEVVALRQSGEVILVASASKIGESGALACGNVEVVALELG